MMADIDFDEFDAGTSMGPAVVGRRYDRLMHLAGAATSAVLLVGAVWWGYELAVRDVTGVPVMRALGGAMRVAPADPGGDVAGHQGLSVNAVAAAGTAAPLPDQLYLAPQAETLAAEDAAGLAQPMVAAAPEAENSDDLPLIESGFSASAPLIATEIPSADQDAVAAALAEALGTPEVSAEPELASATVLTASVRPMPRPAERNAAAASDAAAPVISATAAIVDPASIAVGTRLVQLGAFEDEGAAAADWTRLAAQFPELFASNRWSCSPPKAAAAPFTVCAPWDLSIRTRRAGFAPFLPPKRPPASRSPTDDPTRQDRCGFWV